MPIQNPRDIKEKIVSYVRSKGPSLPVHIAKEIGLSILFTSAFLSELISEQRLKMSSLRIGSSPLYFISGQERMLENFWQSLKSKEKEAFLILKEEKFLLDKEQNPAIRVALRELNDFAAYFEDGGDIIWRYFTIPETDFRREKHSEKEAEEKSQVPEKIIEEKTDKEKESYEKEEKAEYLIEDKKIGNIFDKVNKEVKEKPKKIKEKSKKDGKKNQKKKEESFFNKIKEFLQNKSIEIIDIISMNKEEIVLKVKSKEKDFLVFGYNKKKITEKEIIKSYKKAESLGLEYSILSLGEISKKMKELISAIKTLDFIEKLL
jgi:hypothetical protein